MIHEMKLKPIYFDKMKSGQKIYEVRLNDEKRQLIEIGDIIIFKKEPILNENLHVFVKDLVYFKSFKEMIDSISMEKIGFENSTKEEVEKIYHSFYSVEDERQYGIVAIEIEPIKA